MARRFCGYIFHSTVTSKEFVIPGAADMIYVENHLFSTGLQYLYYFHTTSTHMRDFPQRSLYKKLLVLTAVLEKSRRKEKWCHFCFVFGVDPPLTRLQGVRPKQHQDTLRILFSISFLRLYYEDITGLQRF